MDIEYLDEEEAPPAVQGGREIEYLDGPDDYWGDVRKNAVQGLKEFPGAVKGMAEQAGTIGRGLMPGAIGESAGDVIAGKPIGETPIGQAGKAAYQAGKGIVGGMWQGVKDTGSLAKSGFQLLNDETPLEETEIAQKFRERPISVPLGVAGTLSGLRGGFKALRGKPPVPETMGAVPPEMPGPGGPGIPPETPPGTPGMPPPAGAGAPPPGMFENLMQKAMALKPKVDDLKRYVNRTVETEMAKPGKAAELADFAQEKSQMMAVKAAGGSPLFATQGIRAGKTPIMINDELRAIGQYMLDNKIVVPELGNKFMLGNQEMLLKKAGATIGAVRMMADDLNTPTGYTNQMLRVANDQLGPQYMKGLPGAQQYQTALKIVKRFPSTYKGMADAATELNSLANKANRNFQPHTPFTDVANAISQLNNEQIKTVVGPELAQTYEQGLREFGVNKKIQNMLGRKVGQELHRTGPGSMTRAFYQKFLDEFGYKGGARVLNRMAGNIKANPAMASNLPELFKSFINEVEDILPEQGQGMAHGGIVGEMDAYLTPRYGGVQ